MIRIFIGLLLTISCVMAQTITPSVIASAGAVMKSGNVSLEWTLGEVITETKSTSNLIVTQGFHQTKIGPTAIQNYSINGIDVYPNPVNSKLNIVNKIESNLELKVYSIDGKELLLDKLPIGTKELDMESYPNGCYFLIIKNSDSQQKYTIEKIN
ncbi:MAG: T9SS type A sorting domain-containing protein [Saprospiraceae bacterium]